MAMVVCYTICGKLSVQNRPSSLCEVLIRSFYVSSAVITLLMAFSVKINREMLEPMLRKNGRRLGDIGVPISCAFLHLAWLLYSELKHLAAFSVIAVLWSIVLNLSKTAFFLIYLDLTASLTGKQENLMESVRTISPNFDVLAAKKWEIRDRIRNMNSTFAQILPLIYLEGFLVVISFLGFAISRELPPVRLIFILITMLKDMALLFWMARECSKFHATCMQTDQLLLRGIRRKKMCRSCFSDLSAVLKFNECWDVLKSGCFTHSVENFMKYLATGLTCVAIALPIDFKVMRALNALSSHAP